MKTFTEDWVSPGLRGSDILAFFFLVYWFMNQISMNANIMKIKIFQEGLLFIIKYFI